MKCPFCEGQTVSIQRKYSYRNIVLGEYTAEECPACGAILYPEESLNTILETSKERGYFGEGILEPSDKPDLNDFGFISFGRPEASTIASLFGMTVDHHGWLTEAGKRVPCDGCGESIQIDRLGTIAPGSKKVYHDNPVCFAKYLEKD